MAYRSNVLSSIHLLHIAPADTWHQPDLYPLWNSVEPERDFILKLNDDCLLEIFKYLDLETLVKLSNVCTRLHNLLHQFNFPKFKMYTAFVFHTPVNLLRQTLKCIGPHLEAICLRYQKNINTPENYLEAEHEERATFKILQNIGPKMKKLTIRKPQGEMASRKLVKLFMPVFQQITTLEWDVEFNCQTIQRLHSLCPYLETLILRKRILNCESDHEAFHLKWATLKSVETFQYMATLNLPCQLFFEQFIQSNTQLKHLKLTNVNENLFRVVTEFGQNLEYLEMLQNFDVCGIHSEPTLQLICNLKSLKVVVIRIKMTDSLSEIENQIKCLSQMKHLELIVLVRNYTPPIWPREHFPLAHRWTDISIDGNNMQLRIGDNTASIDFSKENSTLVNIINTNNPKESTYRRMQRDIRIVLETTKDFFPILQQSITFENVDCFQYIQVHSTN